MAMQIKYAFSGDLVIIHDAVGYKPNDINGTWDFYDKDGDLLESVVMEEGAEIHIMDEPGGRLVEASSDDE